MRKILLLFLLIWISTFVFACQDSDFSLSIETIFTTEDNAFFQITAFVPIENEDYQLYLDENDYFEGHVFTEMAPTIKATYPNDSLDLTKFNFTVSFKSGCCEYEKEFCIEIHPLSQTISSATETVQIIANDVTKYQENLFVFDTCSPMVIIPEYSTIGLISYKWKDGTIGIDRTISTSGLYELELEYDFCQTITNIYDVTINENQSDTVYYQICKNDYIIIDSIYYNITKDTLITSESTIDGCDHITHHSISLIENINPYKINCEQGCNFNEVHITYEQTDNQYKWDNIYGDNEYTIDMLNDPMDSIVVKSIDLNGCHSIDTIYINCSSGLVKDYSLYVPNIINLGSVYFQNNDLIFQSDCIETISNAKLYDRWGGLLLDADNILTNRVNQYFSLQKLSVNTGVYLLILIYESNGNKIDVVQDITIIN